MQCCLMSNLYLWRAKSNNGHSTPSAVAQVHSWVKAQLGWEDKSDAVHTLALVLREYVYIEDVKSIGS